MPGNEPSSIIAVIGMAGRFPGAADVEAFWRNLRDGVESISRFTRDELIADGEDPALLDDPGYVPCCGWLEGIELFDAAFFNMTPGEAAITDPQHRVLLECAWHALEDAGYDSERYDGKIGLFAGAGPSSYLLNHLLARPDAIEGIDRFNLLMGNNKDYAPTRASYKLNLRGPSVNVNTACSSSLTAIHLACQSLVDFQSDIAIAGGVGIQTPQRGYIYQPDGILSPDGRCCAFSAQAGGTVSGNGAGLVVLKRYDEALEDGDDIRALVLGSALNNDGAQKVGYTAPSVEGQAEAIAEAMAVSEVEPGSIHYIEAHGTGTSLGDPIEIEALRQAFESNGGAERLRRIGSVKSNIGHLDEAAGVAGFIKTVLALQNEAIPKSLHFEAPNPQIDFEHAGFAVADKTTAWPRGSEPRRAGVSSFGIGGTNAHVVLEEAPRIEVTPCESSWAIVPLSARDPQALNEMKAKLAAHFRDCPEINLQDAAYTLQVGRREFSHRCAVVASNAADAANAFSMDSYKRVVEGEAAESNTPVLFQFPGQGTAYPDMGLGLYETETVFRDSVDRCTSLLTPHLDDDIRAVMFPSRFTPKQPRDIIETQWTQVSLFVTGVSLVELWRSWGVEADAALGHSIGEYGAAWWAGVFSLEDALSAVAMRGRLMGESPEGAMLAVALSESSLIALLPDALDLAAVNSSEQCVVSGAANDIENFERKLAEQGVRCKRLNTSHAFHSRLMEPALDAFRAHIEQLTLNRPAKPFLSNVTGDWADPAQCVRADYWASHIRQPVRYADCLKRAAGDAKRVSIELGPGSVLTALTQSAFNDDRVACAASMRSSRDEIDDGYAIRSAAAQAWANGVELRWDAFHEEEKRRRVSLPGYAFQRKRHWIDPKPPASIPADNRIETDSSTRLPMDRWTWRQSWKRINLPARLSNNERKNCLLIVDDEQTPDGMIEQIKGLGWNLTSVSPPERTVNGTRTLNLDEPDEIDRLFESLRGEGASVDTVLYCVSAGREGLNSLDDSKRSLVKRPLHLIQSLSRRSESKPVEITFITRSMFDVTGDETLIVDNSLLMGWVNSVAFEYPEWSCRIIDRDSYARDGESNSLICAIFSGAVSEQRLAVRGKAAWAPSYEPVDLPQAKTQVAFRDGGVYLIAGGPGGVGLSIAEQIARQARVKLALLSRSARERMQSPEAREALRRIHAEGSETKAFDVDLADGAALKAIIAEIAETMGPVAGVIHAAGEPDGAMIQRRSFESIDAVLKAKVDGALALDEALGESRPDFVALCSALSSDLGSPGQAGYCAANAFLNALATKKTARQSLPWVSIHWDAWRERGMAARSIKEHASTPGETAAQDGAFSLVSAYGAATIFEAEFDPKRDWVLNEHRIEGCAVAPGTAFLEWTRGAWREKTGKSAVELSDVFFLAPMMFADDRLRIARIVLDGESPARFFVMSRDAESDESWMLHAQGMIGPHAETATQMKAPQCHEHETRSIDMGRFGPHWHCVTSANVSGEVYAAELHTPEGTESELNSMPLHPALLDVATGIGVLSEDGLDVFPFSYRRFRLYEPLTSSLQTTAWMTSHDAGRVTFDGIVCSSDGRRLLEFEGYSLKGAVAKTDENKRGSDNYQVAIDAPGDLQSLYFADAARRAPGDHEIEIQIEAAGLNFKEVLYVYGLFDEAPGFEIPLGLECAGTVVACGSSVNEFKPGDRVAAFDANCFRRYATLDAAHAIALPDSLSFEQAAALPAAYMTAWHSLMDRARLQPGERVLIHAAAGGVGMAAVNIARWRGAEIFATAGSDEKREHLRSLGIRHVMNSRTLDFADEIRRITSGRGVDVVLNSLSGEFIEAGLSVLAPYGRFLEIGVRDIYSNTPMGLAPFERHLSYIAIGVGPEMPGFSETWRELFALIACGELPPLPVKAFDANAIREAFDHMARAKHIGKVAIRFRDADEIELQKNNESQTVVTGSAWQVLIETLGIGSAHERKSRDSFAALGLSNEEGGRVFEMAVMAGVPEVIVSTVDLQARLRDAERARRQSDFMPDGYTQESGGSEALQRGDIPSIVKQAWRDTIGAAAAGMDDNFYEMGGDSLLASQLLARIRKRISANLSLSAFLDQPTLGRLCMLAEQAAAQAEEVSAVDADSEMEEGEL